MKQILINMKIFHIHSTVTKTNYNTTSVSNSPGNYSHIHINCTTVHTKVRQP